MKMKDLFFFATHCFREAARCLRIAVYFISPSLQYQQILIKLSTSAPVQESALPAFKNDTRLLSFLKPIFA